MRTDETRNAMTPEPPSMLRDARCRVITRLSQYGNRGDLGRSRRSFSASAAVWIALIIAALSLRSDGQQAQPLEDQLKLARVMPRGASLYVQARDLSALMKRWIASKTRTDFYGGPSYSAFTKSRIYLKLDARKTDFEKAIGFDLNEERLAEIAGGASAVAMYDIGKTELVFVTEVPRAQAIATELFKQAPKFEERSAEGAPYYASEVTTDGGRLKQQFCFAYADNKLIITTAEGLIIRALRNIRTSQTAPDSLIGDVLSSAARIKDTSPADLTMWLDQSRLNDNLYFNAYWLHKNESELARFENGIVKMRLTSRGLEEQRWFTLKSAPHADEQIPAERARSLLHFVPAGGQLVRLTADRATRARAITDTLIGAEPRPSTPTFKAASEQTSDHESEGTSESAVSKSSEVYRRLDSRFDSDVDDEEFTGSAARAQAISSTQTVKASLGQRIETLLKLSGSAAYCDVMRSRLDREKLFVGFDRALIIELSEVGGFDRAAFEKAVTDELRARFVVSGAPQNLAWQEENGVRYVGQTAGGQSLLGASAAYAISGKYLVLASTKDIAADVLKAASSPKAAALEISGTTDYFAVVRIADAMPLFDKLMSTLDGKTINPVKTDDSEPEVKFFSDNISSLIKALAFREVRVRHESQGTELHENLLYSW
ncbi:MAG: hypothetical protein DMF61_05455 [Blastocatellia bacterium AA13]|nr:MAG: hypothetical protein DMF61_05455 [Blastocatellia bacterium AA13]